MQQNSKKGPPLYFLKTPLKNNFAHNPKDPPPLNSNYCASMINLSQQKSTEVKHHIIWNIDKVRSKFLFQIKSVLNLLITLTITLTLTLTLTLTVTLTITLTFTLT